MCDFQSIEAPTYILPPCTTYSFEIAHPFFLLLKWFFCFISSTYTYNI